MHISLLTCVLIIAAGLVSGQELLGPDAKTTAATTVATTTAPPTTVNATTAMTTDNATTAMTTDNATTAMTTDNATTAMTTMATTTVATTMATTPNPEVLYRVNDTKGHACILEMMMVNFMIAYEKTMGENKTEKAMINFEWPQNSQVMAEESMCGNSTMMAVMTLTEGIHGNKFVQMFTVSDKNSALTNVSLSMFHDDTLFPNSTQKGQLVNYTGSLPDTTFMSENGQSYKCNAHQNFGISDNMVNATFSKVKVQTSGIVNDTFSAGTECPQDTSTTVSPATTPGSTVGPPTPDAWNVTENGTVCLMVKMNMTFEISFKNSSNKTDKVQVQLPANASDANSVCGDNMAKFVLNFYDGWILEMDFLLNDKKYNNTKLSLFYIYDGHFKKPLTPHGNKTVTLNDTGIEAGVNKSYACDADSTWKANGVNFMVKDFQVQPFAAPLNGTFGDASHCSADEQFNNIVPIAVGCALAGLVVIVLIAYLIGRQRSSKTGYESV